MITSYDGFVLLLVITGIGRAYVTTLQRSIRLCPRPPNRHDLHEFSQIISDDECSAPFTFTAPE
jgi:hypothetical protein